MTAGYYINNVMLRLNRAFTHLGELAYNLMKTCAKSNGLDPWDAFIAATAVVERLNFPRR